MTLTPEQRSTRSRIAAQARIAQGKSNTRPAREAFMRKFEDQVDPERSLSPAKRAKRAQAAMRAHMASLSLQASKRRAS